MGTDAAITVCAPIPESERRAAAALFWEAFRNKIGPYLAPQERALAFLTRVLDPTHGIAALDRKGRIVGLAGFKTPNGALIGGGWQDLRVIYGVLGAAWRALPLSLFERKAGTGQLLMDGIVVAAEARGQGVGTALLDAIKAHAATLGLSRVRLDVIDANPRARALYERQGFHARGTTDVWPLHRVFGFRSSTEMIFEHTESTRHPQEMPSLRHSTSTERKDK